MIQIGGDFERALMLVNLEDLTAVRLPTEPGRRSFFEWAFSPDSSRLAVARRDVNTLRIFDRNGVPLQEVRLPEGLPPFPLPEEDPDRLAGGSEALGTLPASMTDPEISRFEAPQWGPSSTELAMLIEPRVAKDNIIIIQKVDNHAVDCLLIPLDCYGHIDNP